MKKMILTLLAMVLLAATVLPAEEANEQSVTIYNKNFAVVREKFNLKLKPGENNIRFADAASLVETDSVILRDPTGKVQFGIMEQNYRADTASQGLLLSMYEGKTIEFLKRLGDTEQIVKGKIIRSGYVPHYRGSYNRNGGSHQPIIEVNGQLLFSLPGQPLFPKLDNGVILRPTLSWIINSQSAADFKAELAYISGGMSWKADYNLVSPEKGDKVDIVGWITMDNQSGKNFKNASFKFMAGDVNKISPSPRYKNGARYRDVLMKAEVAGAPNVVEKSFDEFHLYTVGRKTSINDRQKKQIEFIRATGVTAKTLYVYDGARNQKKVAVIREFKNSKENNLGMPLPKGRLRFYRQDEDLQLEFVGENNIDHTAKDEKVRVETGKSFDIVGERKQMNYRRDKLRRMANEDFEIKIKNHKKEEVEVIVKEHLYRYSNWDITTPSHPFEKKDSRTIEFKVKVPADGEVTVKYTAHYTW